MPYFSTEKLRKNDKENRDDKASIKYLWTTLVIFGDDYVHIILVIEILSIRFKQNSNK